MPKYSPSMKLCATCAKWGGTRDVNASRAWSSTQSTNTKGECLGGGHNHHQTPATGTCDKYLKWPVLR